MLFQRKVDKLSSWQDKASKDLASAAPATPAEALTGSFFKRPAPQVRLRPPELCVKALSATTLPGSCRHCQAVAYAQHRTTLTASSLTRLLSPKWGPSRWICKLMQTACRTKKVHDKIRPAPIPTALESDNMLREVVRGEAAAGTVWLTQHFALRRKEDRSPWDICHGHAAVGCAVLLQRAADGSHNHRRAQTFLPRQKLAGSLTRPLDTNCRFQLLQQLFGNGWRRKCG